MIEGFLPRHVSTAVFLRASSEELPETKELLRHVTATPGDSSEEDCKMTTAETCQG